MSDDVRAEPIEAPQLRTLYRFWAPESLHSADREWVGWFDQRHWYAAFGDGMWDVRYVSRWEPLLAPLRELAAEMESHALGLTREATEDNPLRPLALFSDLVSNYRNLQDTLDAIEGKL